MIDEVLKDIREAELKAEEMQKDAYQKGKDIVLQAEIDAENQKKETLKECKQDQKKAVAVAEKNAQDRRNAILKKGQKAAEELIENHNSTVEEISDRIVEMLVNKYC